MLCRTANPTSFLRPVVGSASLLGLSYRTGRKRRTRTDAVSDGRLRPIPDTCGLRLCSDITCVMEMARPIEKALFVPGRSNRLPGSQLFLAPTTARSSRCPPGQSTSTPPCAPTPRSSHRAVVTSPPAALIVSPYALEPPGPMGGGLNMPRRGTDRGRKGTGARERVEKRYRQVNRRAVRCRVVRRRFGRV